MKPYYIFDEALPVSLCQAIISMGLEAKQHSADVYKNNGDVHNPEVRNNTIAWLRNDSINELLSEYVKHANVETGWNFHINSFEIPQFSTYEHGQYYDWHVDMGVEKPTDVAFRKLSISVALNETYTGGDFQIEEWGSPELNRIKTLHAMRTTGAVCVFPSFIQHRVTPVEAGIRYSLVGWFRGDMFK
ncbi:Oxoglutarate/iron-dependent dioxygenase [uncultured Caudovirales phage]|uniref:Oxoglutarate/iron-dependent dioxygenase n=2 Tax=uncultured Caudovirales phage TaxID=2100421 RepID=A0A6J5RRX5_9CAUD|nr:Oxoglutarate/iron-dependent dioxygenase [uncultured Caudovirales phage]CAB4196408.1 Oxoglutarate/iron-dependent dioxygenase [uncultured Caudovirales phage]CAB4204968.1 Oxoglutarate/iron-dependent dioxygenase [uncultured Caudovirales phage]